MPAAPVAVPVDARPSRQRNAVAGLTEAPGPPPLPLDETAARYWLALWTFGTCAASDAYAVALLSDLLGRRETLRALIEAEGWTITTRNGAVIHPAARLLKAAETEAARLLSKLGLDPESRTRIGTPAPAAVVNIANLFEAS